MRPVSWLQLTRIVLSAVLLSAAIGYVFALGDWTSLRGALSHLSYGALLGPCLLIVGGAVLASLRLKLIAKDLGYSLHFRDAAAAHGLGQLLGALFFQIVGQVVARGAYLSRRNVPVSGTIVATAYERALAAAISLALAACGAIYLFGRISFDQGRGGILAIKLIVGVIASGLGAALLSWGHRVLAYVPRIAKHMVFATVRNLALSLVIQLAMVGAYTFLARSIVPDIPTMNLVAASTLVMLAASLPISLAGWGMREMSAILALKTIGVSTGAALAIALVIGFISILVAAAITLVTVGAHWPTTKPAKAVNFIHIDYGMLLDYVMPLAAASAILIQAFLPLKSGFISVNLADPLAIIGGCLFVIHHVGKRWPHWRLPKLENYVLAATAVFAASFLYGTTQFGWTDWAFVNKFLGWFMLLAYGACGALVVNQAKRDGLQLLLRTYAASALSIVVLSVIAITLARCGLTYLNAFAAIPLEGFSANRNAFAFQLLLAICAVLAVRWPKTQWWLGALVAGMLFAGSRAGLVALPVVAAMAFYLRVLTLRTAVAACALAAGLFVFVDFGPKLFWNLFSLVTGSPPTEVIGIATQAVTIDDTPRVKSLVLGWAMFASHPIFGAGLGAFFQQQIEAGNQLVIHSTPLWLLAETGIVGFAIVATPLFRVFFREIRDADPHDHAGIALILTITAFGVEANFHEIMYQRAFWLLFGAALAYASYPARRSTGGA
jgi:hypothetical protein